MDSVKDSLNITFVYFFYFKKCLEIRALLSLLWLCFLVYITEAFVFCCCNLSSPKDLKVSPHGINNTTTTTCLWLWSCCFFRFEVTVRSDVEAATGSTSSLVLPPSLMTSAPGSRVAMTVHLTDKAFEVCTFLSFGRSVCVCVCHTLSDRFFSLALPPPSFLLFSFPQSCLYPAVFLACRRVSHVLFVFVQLTCL